MSEDKLKRTTVALELTNEQENLFNELKVRYGVSMKYIIELCLKKRINLNDVYERYTFIELESRLEDIKD